MAGTALKYFHSTHRSPREPEYQLSGTPAVYEVLSFSAYTSRGKSFVMVRVYSDSRMRQAASCFASGALYSISAYFARRCIARPSLPCLGCSSNRSNSSVG